MNVEDHVLCCGCLCAGRKMILLDEFRKKQCFLQIINEIPMAHSENLPLWLCWECEAHNNHFMKFKQKVKTSYQMLHEYAKENLDLLHLKQPSSLQVKILKNIDITTNCNDDTSIEQLKLESDWEAKSVLQSDSNIKIEDDVTSLHSDKIMSDTEVDSLHIEILKKDKSKKKKKSKSKNHKAPKSKQKQKKSKKSKIETVEFCKEIEFSQTELEKERSELCLKEEFVNALFKCERCILPFPNADDLSDHVAMKHDLNASHFKCRTCECSFANEVSFNYHRNKHIKRYECLLCVERFNSKRKVTKHYEQDHCGIVCNICMSAFVSQEDHTTHIQTHSQSQAGGVAGETGMFPCEQCDKTFRWKTSLRKHTETHRIQTGQKRKPYCETCRLSFTTTSNLQKHVKTSSKHQIQLKLRKLNESTTAPPIGDTSQEACIEQIKRSVNSARSTHKCPQCDRRFQWKGNLLRHVQSHTARANGELVCAPCNRSFSSIATYEQHLKISRKHVSENDYKYTCDECGKKFVNKTRLRDHVDWEHLNKHTHKCKLCQKVFKSHTSLYLHRQVVHKKDEAEHLCDHCGKAFPNHAKLRCHIAALHTAESPYSCGICSARFNWHSCLSRHVRVLHTLNKGRKKASQLEG